MIVDNDLCVHCAACVGICPTNDILLHGASRLVILPSCTECGLCAVVCPVGALAPDPGAPLPPALRRRSGFERAWVDATPLSAVKDRLS